MPKFKKSTPVPLTPIVIDGETYNLKYDFAAFRQAETELTKFWGKRVTIPGVLGAMFEAETVTSIISDKVSINDMCILLWCGLLHEYPKLTIEEISNFLDLSDLATVMPTIVEAIGNSMTKAKPEDEARESNNVEKNVVTLQ